MSELNQDDIDALLNTGGSQEKPAADSSELGQDDIDSLLNSEGLDFSESQGGAAINNAAGEANAIATVLEAGVSEEQYNRLIEICIECFKTASGALELGISRPGKTDISQIAPYAGNPQKLFSSDNSPHVVISAKISGPSDGEIYWLIPQKDALALIIAMEASITGMPDEDIVAARENQWDDESTETIGEIFSQIYASLGTMMRSEIDGSVKLARDTVTVVSSEEELASALGDCNVVLGSTLSLDIMLEGVDACTGALVFPADLVRSLIVASSPEPVKETKKPASNSDISANLKYIADLPESNKIKAISKIRIPVMVNLASKDDSIESIMDITLGSVITFEKNCESLLDLCVGSRLIAQGEVVTVAEHFGIQLQRMVPKAEILNAKL